jgi:hypothetical protein
MWFAGTPPLNVRNCQNHAEAVVDACQQLQDAQPVYRVNYKPALPVPVAERTACHHGSIVVSSLVCICTLLTVFLTALSVFAGTGHSSGQHQLPSRVPSRVCGRRGRQHCGHKQRRRCHALGRVCAHALQAAGA